MSQKKVDQRKYEKYHRKEIQKKERMKTLAGVIIATAIIGIIIGFPLGRFIYNQIPKYVSPNTLDSWVSAYVSDKEGYPFVPATTEDTTGEDSTGNDTSSEAADDTTATDKIDTTEDVTSEAATTE